MDYQGMGRIGRIANYKNIWESVAALAGKDKETVDLNAVIDRCLNARNFTSYNREQEKLEEATLESEILVFDSGYTFKDGGRIAIFFEKEEEYDRWKAYPRSMEAPFQELGNLTEETKNAIYNILRKEFEFDKAIPMATVSILLKDCGFNYREFGYLKMKDMLADLGYLGLQEIKSIDAPSMNIILREDKERTDGEEKKDPATDIFTPIVVAPNKLEQIRSVLEMPEYDADLIKEAIDRALEKAKESNVNKVKLNKKTGAYGFDVEFDELNAAVYVTVLYDEKKNYWYVNYASKPRPSKAVFDFALWGSKADIFDFQILEDLVTLADPEQWSVEPGDYKILRSYLTYTFYRLQNEEKIVESNDGKYAAFNTGLADRIGLEPIYAFFERNGTSEHPRWRFKEFCVPGQRSGKKMIDNFDEKPKRASYFKNSKQELLYDTDRDLGPNYEHIVFDNLLRFPMEFLKDCLRKSTKALTLLEMIETTNDSVKKSNLLSELTKMLKEESTLYQSLQKEIEAAIGYSKKKIRWNYRTALPSYYPSNDRMSFMIPLWLTGKKGADIALVAERSPKTGHYQGNTVLTLDQAYMDSRLICRPDSDWLNPDMLCTTSATVKPIEAKPDPAAEKPEPVVTETPKAEEMAAAPVAAEIPEAEKPLAAEEPMVAEAPKTEEPAIAEESVAVDTSAAEEIGEAPAFAEEEERKAEKAPVEETQSLFSFFNFVPRKPFVASEKEKAPKEVEAPIAEAPVEEVPATQEVPAVPEEEEVFDEARIGEELDVTITERTLRGGCKCLCAADGKDYYTLQKSFAQGLEVGQQLRVAIVGINPQKNRYLVRPL